ncbi:uncharacterized protein PHACADRAFT_141343 [Phanerochaete carnosa HHB-10118-sp]|uniref:Uncharacterized protein n=1 Tax=Phanerochaete carnosa (strain HHB-10118-sp) TaxID=650164 RepID=K5WBI3_PHACS|nr:uncharacterized protein PHACADRAFT_141343 [Phanerochaete carnosa HHB-10118-sp]EKM56580.1 hypothetical protein PHACADRAFT_141343 [Phanerochaete carnosa HHB-10118-sp]
MFFLRRPLSAPDEIYSSCLSTLHEGHALWYPEPHASGEPQIGDVGFIRTGAFIRLFNLDTSAPGKKVVEWDTPFEITEPLPQGMLKVDPRRRPLVPAHYRSHGVESRQAHASAGIAAGTNVSVALSAEYTCKAAQGAVLALKSEADAESIYDNLALKEYILRHHDEWYTYARGILRHDVKREDIVMIIGWVKTEADWAAAVFSNTSTSSSVSIEGRGGGVAGMGMGTSHTSSVTGPTMQRQGENYLANAPGPVPAVPKRDQSALVKRYKVRKWLGVVKRVVAGGGYHRLPDGGDERGGSAEEGISAQEMGDVDEKSILDMWNEVLTKHQSKVPDPLNVLLDYIHEVCPLNSLSHCTTGVETAIASDDDVWSIVGGKSVIDFASYLRRIQPPVHIDGAVGSLCMEDVISHKRASAFSRQNITWSDLAEWPDAALDGADRLEDGRAFTSPLDAEPRPLNLKRVTFNDPQDPSRDCYRFALSADGKLLAASFGSIDILVWRLSDGLLVQRLHHQGHRSNVITLSFSPIDYNLVSGSSDGTVIVWDTRRGRVLLHLEGHSAQVNGIAYTADGALIATGPCDRGSRSDKSVKVWDTSSGACLHSFSVGNDVDELTFSPDSTRLYVRLTTSCVIYDIHTYARTATLQHIAGEVLLSLMSHQGDRIVTGPTSDHPGQVKIWNAVTGEELLTIDHPKKLSEPVAFSPDGSEVVVGCPAKTAAVTYDSRTGHLRHVFKLAKPARHAIYSPDGDCVAFGAEYGDLEVYDAKSGTFLVRFDEHEGSERLYEMRFLSDSQSLLARFSNGPLVLYNIQDVLRMR